MTVRNSELAPLLSTAGEGEIIMAGTLLKGLSDEKIAWVVIENVPDGACNRITLHAYWHNIFVVSKVVRVMAGTEIFWGVTEI